MGLTRRVGLSRLSVGEREGSGEGGRDGMDRSNRLAFAVRRKLVASALQGPPRCSSLRDINAHFNRAVIKCHLTLPLTVIAAWPIACA